MIFVAVTQEERDAKKSDPALERGLVFVSYQSQLEKGFRFLQIPWSNNPDFALHKDPTPGTSGHRLDCSARFRCI